MPYRFALVGCGNIAGRHAEQILRVGKLSGVCDIDAGKVRDFAAKYNTPSYSNLTDMLRAEQPDMVCICTPNGIHAEQALQAMDLGCDVLCEKPMAIKVQDGLQIIKKAESTGKRFFVVKQNRYNPPVVLVKDLLSRNRLGTIQAFQLNCFWNRPDQYYQGSWRGTQDLDGGILFTQFSHFIDLLYWFLGDMDRVSGWRNNYGHQSSVQFEDTGVATIVMQSGAMGSLHYTINSHHANMEGSFTLFGEKGTVKIGGQYLNRIDHFSVEDETLPRLPSSNPANQYEFYTGSMGNHHRVYDDVILSLNGSPSASPAVEAAEALRSIDMIERIYEASPRLQKARH